MAPISIGTDCSGMEAPVQAMRNLGVKYEHAFSCDICKFARATIEANFPHGRMYEDVTTRDNTTAPAVDVYVAGFPCQPFSSAGLRQGFSDLRGRGTIFFDVRDYIDKQRPKVFFLENVRGFRTLKGGEYFKAVMESLDSLDSYNISVGLMNTEQHGIPHHRVRTYIVGIRRDVDRGTFTFPEPIPCPPIECFLEERPSRSVASRALPPVTQTNARKNVVEAKRVLRRQGSDPAEEDVIIDCDSTPRFAKWMPGVSPCITCGRHAGHWVTSRGRRFLKTEMMRLQGMDPTKFKVVVSALQLGRQLGNTMSVNVLERLFCRALPAAGLARPGSLRDRWADGSAVRSLAATRSAKLAVSFRRPNTATPGKAAAPSPATTGPSAAKAPALPRKRAAFALRSATAKRAKA